jgi:hypothetical protein
VTFVFGVDRTWVQTQVDSKDPLAGPDVAPIPRVICGRFYGQLAAIGRSSIEEICDARRLHRRGPCGSAM